MAVGSSPSGLGSPVAAKAKPLKGDSVMQDGDRRSYITHCIVQPRGGDSIFTLYNGEVLARMDGYAIIPLEEYFVLKGDTLRSFLDGLKSEVGPVRESTSNRLPKNDEGQAIAGRPHGSKIVPIFDLWNQDHHHYRIYSDGTFEGFPDCVGGYNMLPVIMAEVPHWNQPLQSGSPAIQFGGDS